MGISQKAANSLEMYDIHRRSVKTVWNFIGQLLFTSNDKSGDSHLLEWKHFTH